jgi:glycosyltransferase involved in cell wall biosynthesis
VTALCLTRNRRQWLPKAIHCFQQQSYRKTELLILADGEDVRDLIPADDRIRLIHLAESRNIGEKRNYGCDRAAGEVICHWDDDDWSAPGRLARQIEMLNESGLKLAGFCSMRFTDGVNWWRYKGTKNYALGTSLCYRRDWWLSNPFRPTSIGEDNHMVWAAQAAKQIVSEDAGDLMVASVHGDNTSKRNAANWEKITGPANFFGVGSLAR